MATKFKDYTIYYNGNLICKKENTELTSVDISYKDEVICSGEKTLLCKNNIMDSNLKVGDVTLLCDQTHMDGNVQVTTTDRYKWRQYNIKWVKVATARGDKLFFETWYDYGTWDDLSYGYTSYEYNINQDTGQFELVNPGVYSVQSDCHDMHHSMYGDVGPGRFTCGSRGEGDKSAYFYASQNRWTDGAGKYHIDVGLSGPEICQSNTETAYLSKSEYSNYWRSDPYTSYMLTSTPTKGEPTGVIVDSLDSAAYPADGNQGDYWYVAI